MSAAINFLYSSSIPAGFFMHKTIDWQLCIGLPTQCYRNLNNGSISLRQKVGKSWLVVGHTKNLVIQNPIFTVSESRRQRVIRDRRKNVHAFSCGILIGQELDTLPPIEEIYYDPYTLPYFAWRETNRPIDRADLLVVINNRVFCPIESTRSQLTLF
jgi:hypothetical protein